MIGYDLDRSVGRANDEAYGSDLTGLRPETDNNNTVSSKKDAGRQRRRG